MYTKTKQKVVDYEVYVADDGKEFNSENACRDYELKQKGLRKVCPRCNGRGEINGHTEEYFDSPVNWGDGKYHTRWVSDRCPECNGKGYLDKKVTETWE